MSDFDEHTHKLEPLAVYLCVARKHHQELLGSFGGTVKETAETIGRAAKNYREISRNYREINDVVWANYVYVKTEFLEPVYLSVPRKRYQ